MVAAEKPNEYLKTGLGCCSRPYRSTFHHNVPTLSLIIEVLKIKPMCSRFNVSSLSLHPANTFSGAMLLIALALQK